MKKQILIGTLTALGLQIGVHAEKKTVAPPETAPTPTPVPTTAASPVIPTSQEIKEFDVNRLIFDGVTALDKGALDTGRLKFRKALELDSKNLKALVNLGSLEYRARRYDEAEKVLRQATRVAPDNFSAWMTLGVVAHDAGKLDLALAALSQAVLIEPSNSKAHAYLGVTIGRKGWLDGAEAELHRALQLDETSRDAHFNLAVICLQRNPPSIELARRHYRRALELGATADDLIEKRLKEAEVPSETPSPEPAPAKKAPKKEAIKPKK